MDVDYTGVRCHQLWQTNNDYAFIFQVTRALVINHLNYIRMSFALTGDSIFLAANRANLSDLCPQRQLGNWT